MKSFYDILNINESATPDQIKTAYHAFLLANHPDKLVNGGVAREQIDVAKQAWRTLKDHQLRSVYDQWLREQRIRASDGVDADIVRVTETNDRGE
jgi:DnaJ-class molecular chaperone